MLLTPSVVLSVAFAVYFVAILRPRGVLNANAIFVYIQMIMAIGSFSLLTTEQPADHAYSYVLFVSMMVYLVVSAAVLVAGRQPAALQGSTLMVRPTATLWALTAFSCVVVVLYYYAVGYSALFRGLSNSLSGGDADIAGERLNSYSGATYLFPGYVNQFKNVILPSLTVVAIAYWRSVRQSHVVLRVLLVGIALFGLLGTGQRGAFIQFMATLVLFLYFSNGHRLPKAAKRLAIFAFSVVVVSTIALGRSNDSLGSDATLGDRAYVAASEFVSRVFQVQQYSAVAGFRYIYEQPIQWGHEWLQGLMGILPSSSGTDLPNRIYEILYGTDRGTAPPGIWGSAYHNLGWFGVVVVPGVLAVAIASVTKRSLSAQQRNSLETIGIAGVSVSLGFWAAGGPEAVLNTGLVAYLVLWVWGFRLRTRDLPPPAGPSTVAGPGAPAVPTKAAATRSTPARRRPEPVRAAQHAPSRPTGRPAPTPGG